MPERHVSVRAEYRYGMVLSLLMVTFILMSNGATGAWARTLTIALQGLTLLAALYASSSPPKLRRAALVFVVVMIVATVVATPVDATVPAGATALLNGLLVALAPVAIVAGVVRRKVIDIQTVLAALCVYVLIGMFFAFVYQAVSEIASEQFFVQDANPTSADYLYFSYITQTTVGYGDLTAANSVGRSMAVLEALTGQIYLVTIVALLVSNLVPRHRREEQSSSGQGDAAQ
jgi:hypothetical protein